MSQAGLTKENQEHLLKMLKDICGPLVHEVVGQQMANVREELKAAQESPIPAWIQQLAMQPQIPDTAKELVQQGGIATKQVPSDEMVARIVTAIAAGKAVPELGRMGWYKSRYGEDAIFKALAATDAVAGGFLIPEAQSMEVIELLRPASVFRQMNPMMETMENGKLTLPGLATGAAATYIAENSNISKTEPTFRQVILTAKKLAALVPISNDLIRRKSGTSTIVRDDLITALAEKSDAVFIRSDGTSGEPKGLRYWAPNNSTHRYNVNGTVNTENVLGDLGNLMLALMNDNSRMIRPGWLMAPRTWMALMVMTDANGNAFLREEVSAMRLFGYPLRFTTNIPINLAVTGSAESELYFADFADVVIGESTTLIVDASTEAAYHDGSSVQAAFSLDQTVVRAIIEHDLVVRHPESVAVAIDVDWTPGITT